MSLFPILGRIIMLLEGTTKPIHLSTTKWL